MTQLDRTKTLERVRKILDKAADPACTPEEAESFRSKADELMIRYAIQEAELERVKGARTEEPITVHIRVTDGGTPIRQMLGDLLFSVARHNRCRAVSHGYNHPDDTPLDMTVVGFPVDVQFVEMLFTSMRLEIANKMWPNADPSESYEDNLIRLKEAGLKWEHIHAKLYSAGILDKPFTRNIAVRFTKDYTNACKARDRERMYVQPTTHQRSWMTGFLYRVDRRLHENRMRADRDMRKATNNGRGTEIVLRDRNQRVTDAFTEMFPELSAARPKRSKIVGASWSAGDKAGREADLGSPRVAQRKALQG